MGKGNLLSFVHRFYGLWYDNVKKVKKVCGESEIVDYKDSNIDKIKRTFQLRKAFFKLFEINRLLFSKLELR